mmetsp:Transcript_33589/g.79208  ORF Transcript_33589/g.79208 Transcript_33589/m.79208 type:complete len:385 (+) Transcript_33589:122-1276(+)
MEGINATLNFSSISAHSNAVVATSDPDAETGTQNELHGRQRLSSFDISLLSNQSIRKRELYEFSVHYSVSSSSWVARITTSCNSEESGRRCLSFSFATENEGRKFAKAYSPPKMVTNLLRCFCCSAKFGNKRAPFSCKNCGVQTCESCSRRWGVRMIPKTYLGGSMNATSTTVRVCKSCDWLSNAFCMALLQGQHNNAVLIHATGNINLRCAFADIHKEAMFPLHCAVMGGNLDIVKWLVEAHGCPLSVKRSPTSGMPQSIQTSKSRTLLDIVMTGRPKIDILAYLVSKNMNVTDTKDPALASRTLQTLVSPGNNFLNPPGKSNSCCDSSVSTVEDACIICCERQMNCVLAPCGHQVCCSDCGNHLSECPICKRTCSVLRIFKS